MALVDYRIQIESTLPRAIDDANVVLLYTSSGTAVIDPVNLRKPALITSISTNALKAHEVPPGSLGSMDVYCDYRAATPSSASEMQVAVAEHGWSVASVVGDLSELTTGRAVLPSYGRHVFFRSIGLGLETSPWRTPCSTWFRATTTRITEDRPRVATRWDRCRLEDSI